MLIEQPLKGGIIGCGFFAQFHIDAWRRMPGVEIVAAADPDLARARNFAEKIYATAEEMLDAERLDFVDIATRPELHLPLVRLAAERRVPAICQKPMAPDWQQAVQMVDAVEGAGVPFMIHENWRWQPWYRFVHRQIQGGAIGKPISYYFRTRKKDGLGPEPYTAQPYFRIMPRLLIYETLVHHIDTARFLFGDIAEIFARIRRANPLIKGEDTVHLITAHQSALTGIIDGNRFCEPVPTGPVLGEATFEGEDAVLYVMGNGDVYREDDRIYTARDSGYRGDSVLATQQHFIDGLRTGAPFESSAREYLKTVRVVEAAYQSAAEGRTIAV
jgi:predicted dehydrogenase